MAKWLKINDTYFNLGQIRQIRRLKCRVEIDGMPVAHCETEEQAEQWITEFIAEHYIQTSRVE